MEELKGLYPLNGHLLVRWFLRVGKRRALISLEGWVAGGWGGGAWRWEAAKRQLGHRCATERHTYCYHALPGIPASVEEDSSDTI